MAAFSGLGSWLNVNSHLGRVDRDLQEIKRLECIACNIMHKADAVESDAWRALHTSQIYATG